MEMAEGEPTRVDLNLNLTCLGIFTFADIEIHRGDTCNLILSLLHVPGVRQRRVTTRSVPSANCGTKLFIRIN